VVAVPPTRLLLQRLDEAEPGQRVRAHVDLGCTDRDATVAWHVGLGARVADEHQYWTVLTDPAGHEYCLVGRPPWAPQAAAN
jgi:Glyoxalase-like domain